MSEEKTELWKEAVNSIYIEILAKSLVECYEEFSEKYWPYVRSIVSKTMENAEHVVLGHYFYRRDPLLRRLWGLQIKIEV